jgi:mRNA interferase MazF
VVKAGDIITLWFGNGSGHEQKGRRPAVVMSNSMFNEMSSTVIVCPITGSEKPFPLNVALDDRTETKGSILCAQARAFDLSERRYKYRESLPPDLLHRCHGILHAALSPEG